MEQILVWLPGLIEGIACEKPWTLNLEDEGEKVGVYFSKGDGSNGKPFLRIAKKDKKAFIKAVQ